MYSHFQRYMMLQYMADKEKEKALKEMYEEVDKKMEEYKKKVEENKESD